MTGIGARLSTRLGALLEGARPLNAALVAPAVGLGALLAGGREALLEPATGLAALATVLSLAAGNLWNDLADRVEDAVNAPRRPLPSGRLTPAWAWTGALVAAALGLAAAWRVGPGALRLTVACQAALAWYARRGKGWPLLGNALVAVLSATAVVFGAAVAGDLLAALAPALLAGLVHFLREAVKDLADAEGDALAGRATWARSLGPERLRARLLPLLALLPATALWALLRGGPPELAAAHAFAAGPAVLWAALFLRRKDLADRAACLRSAAGLKALLAAGLAVYGLAGWLAG